MFSFANLADIHFLHRTIVWAVDLDDQNGTSINALGSGLSRAASPVYNDTAPTDSGPDLGTLGDDSTDQETMQLSGKLRRYLP
jgi:hypothetical protein